MQQDEPPAEPPAPHINQNVAMNPDRAQKNSIMRKWSMAGMWASSVPDAQQKEAQMQQKFEAQEEGRTAAEEPAAGEPKPTPRAENILAKLSATKFRAKNAAKGGSNMNSPFAALAPEPLQAEGGVGGAAAVKKVSKAQQKRELIKRVQSLGVVNAPSTQEQQKHSRLPTIVGIRTRKRPPPASMKPGLQGLGLEDHHLKKWESIKAAYKDMPFHPPAADAGGGGGGGEAEEAEGKGEEQEKNTAHAHAVSGPWGLHLPGVFGKRG
eukprot:Tamp_13520.p2 GENE.Tamp_13520~~Tamp_13520.p2  ORF type:complete len:266 (-),score=73.21 Tamp_13520:344-1141(-)